MQNNENPVFGRKVFFLNPSLSVQNIAVERLRAMEYEVYVIPDYRNAKSILRAYPDSICFIDVDSQLTPKEWFNYISSFSSDESLKSIFIGILTSSLKKSQKDQFLLKINIPAGLVPLNTSIEYFVDVIKEILDLNGAKGRRQYVRFKCAGNPNINLYLNRGNKLLNYPMVDISSVGLACTIPAQEESLYPKNEIITSCSVKMGLKTINFGSVIFGTKNDGANCTLILIFLQSTPAEVRNEIRKFIFTTLQENINVTAQNLPSDLTDYSVEQISDNGKTTNHTFIDDQEIEDIGDIVELEEVFN
ncbi:MAG: hypothetical protein MJ169_03310 [Treponema sp.]|nr:hypothetical protein [Treponema sp.]